MTSNIVKYLLDEYMNDYLEGINSDSIGVGVKIFK